MQRRSDVHRLAEVYEGVAVLGAVPGSPASVAGSRYGDVILKINGRRVRNIDDYVEASGQANETFDMVVMRDGKEIRLALQLGKRVDAREALEYAAETRVFGPESDQSDRSALD